MGTFSGITFDDLLHCSNVEYSAGVKTRLIYAPSEFFSIIKLPEESGDFQKNFKIQENDIVFKGTLNWSFIDILIDENEIKSLLDGGVQRKKTKSKINFYILGFRSKVLGFIEALRNTPMVFGIEDNDGTYWLLGNLRNRAFIESAESSSGKKYEENSGAAVTVSSNSQLYFFKGRIEMNPGNGSGSGSGGFIDLTQDY